MQTKLSYNQLRQILALAISNDTIKAKLADLLAGKMAEVSELDLLAMISRSEVDKELIAILSGKDPDKMDALEGLEYISAFFAYIASNKEKYASWLASIGLKTPTKKKQTSPNSK